MHARCAPHVINTCCGSAGQGSGVHHRTGVSFPLLGHLVLKLSSNMSLQRELAHPSTVAGSVRHMRSAATDAAHSLVLSAIYLLLPAILVILNAFHLQQFPWVAQIAGATVGALMEALLIPGLHLGKNPFRAPGCFYPGHVNMWQ